MIVLTYKLFSFNDKDSNRGMTVDKDSFIKYIESPEFKKKLKAKILFGCNSHQERDKFVSEHTNSVGVHSDYLLANNKISNILTNIKVEGDDVIGDLLVLDTIPGKLLRLLIEVDCDIEVSISMYTSYHGGKYYITELNGVDTTVNPAFNTELLNKREYNP